MGSCRIRFARAGWVDRSVELPVTTPTRCCFAGPGPRMLHVTSARFGLSPEQLACNPAEGPILAVDASMTGPPSVHLAG